MEEQTTPTPENVANLNQNSAALHGGKVEIVGPNENGVFSNGVHGEDSCNRLQLSELEQKPILGGVTDMTTSASQDTGFGSASVSEVSSPVENREEISRGENPAVESETEVETFNSVVLDGETENDENTLNSEASFENIVQIASTEDVSNKDKEKTEELVGSETESTSVGNEATGGEEKNIVEKTRDEAENEQNKHVSDIVDDGTVKDLADYNTETEQKLLDNMNVKSTHTDSGNDDKTVSGKAIDRNVDDTTNLQAEPYNEIHSLNNVEQSEVNSKITDDAMEVVNINGTTNEVVKKEDYSTVSRPEVEKASSSDTENENIKKETTDATHHIETEKEPGNEAIPEKTVYEREQYPVANEPGEVEKVEGGEHQKTNGVATEATLKADDVAAEATLKADNIAAEATLKADDVAAEATLITDNIAAEATLKADNIAAEATLKADNIAAEATQNKAEDNEAENDDEKGTMDILGNGLLKKKVLVPGKGVHTRPNNGDSVTVRVDGQLPDGTHVDTGEITFTLNDGDVILAFDLAVALMEEGEKCELFTSERYAYGSLGREPDIPKDTSITYTLELVRIEPPPLVTEMNYDQRLKLGEAKRERGNYLFGRTDYSGAINSYSRAVKLLDNPELNEGVDESCRSVLTESWVKCYNNLAACQLKIDAVDSAIKSCEKVLSVQKDNVKALFRLGKAYGIKGEIDVAIKYLRRAIRLDPESKIMQQEMLNLTRRKSKETATEKELYQRMLGVKPGERFLAEEHKKANSNKLVKWTLVAGGVAAVLISVGLTWYRAS